MMVVIKSGTERQTVVCCSAIVAAQQPAFLLALVGGQFEGDFVVLLQHARVLLLETVQFLAPEGLVLVSLLGLPDLEDVELDAHPPHEFVLLAHLHLQLLHQFLQEDLALPNGPAVVGLRLLQSLLSFSEHLLDQQVLSLQLAHLILEPLNGEHDLCVLVVCDLPLEFLEIAGLGLLDAFPEGFPLFVEIYLLQEEAVLPQRLFCLRLQLLHSLLQLPVGARCFLQFRPQLPHPPLQPHPLQLPLHPSPPLSLTTALGFGGGRRAQRPSFVAFRQAPDAGKSALRGGLHSEPFLGYVFDVAVLGSGRTEIVLASGAGVTGAAGKAFIAGSLRAGLLAAGNVSLSLGRGGRRGEQFRLFLHIKINKHLPPSINHVSTLLHPPHHRIHPNISLDFESGLTTQWKLRLLLPQISLDCRVFDLQGQKIVQKWDCW